MSISDIQYQERKQKSQEAEDKALVEFDAHVALALKHALPISMWGDGNCGELIRRFEMHLIASGLMRAEERKPAARKKEGIPPKLRLEVYERDRYRCVYCGSWKNLTIDHIHPESKGGETTLSNLQTLCRSCNCSKGTKILQGAAA